MGEMIKCFGLNLKESSWWGRFGKQGGDKTRLARVQGSPLYFFSNFVCLNISKIKILRNKKEAGAATWRGLLPSHGVTRTR